MQSRSSDTVEGPASGPVDEETQAVLAERAGELALSQELTVAVAESLTGGMIATALAAPSGRASGSSGRWWPTPVRSSTTSWTCRTDPS